MVLYMSFAFSWLAAAGLKLGRRAVQQYKVHLYCTKSSAREKLHVDGWGVHHPFRVCLLASHHASATAGKKALQHGLMQCLYCQLMQRTGGA